MSGAAAFRERDGLHRVGKIITSFCLIQRQDDSFIDAEKANVKFTNGILRIELPRTDATGVKKITIQ